VTAGHFIYIPLVLLVGVVLGWVLGSRAVRDAYAAELRRREERAGRARGTEDDRPDERDYRKH
jgi:hypothetical protein